jgi:hypothetical protein
VECRGDARGGDAKTPPLAGSLKLTQSNGAALADPVVDDLLAKKRWADARTRIGQNAQLGTNWGGAAHGREAKALDALPSETPLAELPTLVDEYAAVVAGPAPDAAVKRSLDKLRTRVGKLGDKELADALAAADCKRADKILADLTPRAPASWAKSASATIEKK